MIETLGIVGLVVVVLGAIIGLIFLALLADGMGR